MKNIFITSLILVICSATAACDNVSVDGDVACDNGTIKCIDSSHYVMCNNRKWNDSPLECAVQNSCSEGNIATCLAQSNPIEKCDQNSVKCLDGGYSICTKAGEWSQIENCPSGSTCTNIEECFTQTPENQCNDGEKKCESENPAQYRICNDHQWGELQNCPGDQICSSSTNQCVDAQEIPADNCETGVIRCYKNRASYVICDSNGKWSEPIDCPSKKICSGNIIQCFNSDEPSPDNNSVIQCDANNSNQYVICTNGACGNPQDCPNSKLGCKEHIGNCFKNIEESKICEDGMFQCDMETQYRICKENKWSNWDTCPNENKCTSGIQDCFKPKEGIGELKCSDDNQKLMIYENDTWTTKDECNAKRQICSNLFGDYMCHIADVCTKDPYNSYQLSRDVYTCENNSYYKSKDQENCNLSNDAYMCIYDGISENYISIQKIDKKGIKNNMEDIKNYYKDYDKKDNVCFWNYKSDSDAFLKGSSICIYENDHYSVYQCDGEWSYKSECNNCSQTGILIGKNWRPDGWTYPRNLYNLTALCIPDNYGLHCENDSIQFRFINNTTITIADCTSIGRKCELDSDGKPHCK